MYIVNAAVVDSTHAPMSRNEKKRLWQQQSIALRRRRFNHSILGTAPCRCRCPRGRRASLGTGKSPTQSQEQRPSAPLVEAAERDAGGERGGSRQARPQDRSNSVTLRRCPRLRRCHCRACLPGVLRGRAAGLLAVFLDLHRDGAMRRCKVNQEAHFAEARCDADEEAVGDVGGGEASNNVETSRVWLGVLPLGDGGVREWGGGDLSTGARRPQTRTPSR